MKRVWDATSGMDDAERLLMKNDGKRTLIGVVSNLETSIGKIEGDGDVDG